MNDLRLFLAMMRTKFSLEKKGSSFQLFYGYLRSGLEVTFDKLILEIVSSPSATLLRIALECFLSQFLNAFPINFS